jgi:hypothetical protein
MMGGVGNQNGDYGVGEVPMNAPRGPGVLESVAVETEQKSI